MNNKHQFYKAASLTISILMVVLFFFKIYELEIYVILFGLVCYLTGKSKLRDTEKLE
ncbi:hypothetical protein [Flectobacillus rivi]|uniref:Uncharacterized protein n=1 Tax=Flectobacillus rivi TaxID=2984209 RepID=A0ABT6Z556_9BACT|nr:hypothetical protein [Flectobacillus rivi]MDI9876242.1 hypothetical protein [Flectobacillus rivi]